MLTQTLRGSKNIRFYGLRKCPLHRVTCYNLRGCTCNPEGRRDPGRVRSAPGELVDGPELRRKRWAYFKGTSPGKVCQRRYQVGGRGNGGRKRPETQEEIAARNRRRRGKTERQHSQGMRNFGIETESYSSVVMRRNKPEEKN
ncbi:hypothetical protein NDU88_001366 [Pleurodeles waltl]|uniref:Uncharacterized protein n=1 Tax=Pleurodeles waltl TaxID=8319 RepID=A0AAV7NC80_PLEWA|nr:hypothetical protein NDU88_001366 [Pleurodeles waltl]